MILELVRLREQAPEGAEAPTEGGTEEPKPEEGETPAP